MWVAAGVTVVNSHSDHYQKLTSALETLNHSQRRPLLSDTDVVGLRVFSHVPGSD